MILNIDQINKSFGKQLVLKQINLVIDEPRLIALVAPNGSGKTTLLNIICNLEKADSGDIEVCDLPNNNTSIFEELTYMQDNSVLYTDLTGMDHIKLVQAVHDLTDDRVTEVLNKLKMSDYMDKKVKNYSLGMKQHLLFALAILPQPRILLMDEPLNGLDPASVVRVRDYLIELFKNGTTILFSSHNLDQIDKLTDDIFFLKDNRLIAYDEIRNQHFKRSYSIVTDDAHKFLEKIQSIINDGEILTEYKCSIKCTQEELKQILSVDNVTIFDYQEVNVSLEKLYFELFEDYNYETTTI